MLPGLVGTVTAAATAPTPAQADQPAATTPDLPPLDDLLTTSVDRAAEATDHYALRAELRQRESSDLAAAARAAARAKAEEDRAARRAATADGHGTVDGAGGAGDADDAVGRGADDPPTPAAGSGAAAVDFARAQLGAAYRLGGTGPDTWDCSGLTQAAHEAAGTTLPRTAEQQSTAGTPVPLDALHPGDLVYWGPAGQAHHIALYVGDGRFVGAQNPETGVVEEELSWDPPTGAVRVG